MSIPSPTVSSPSRPPAVSSTSAQPRPPREAGTAGGARAPAHASAAAEDRFASDAEARPRIGLAMAPNRDGRSVAPIAPSEVPTDDEALRTLPPRERKRLLLGVGEHLRAL